MTAYSADRKAEHLLRLSSEVSRIAGTLVRLSGEEGPLRPTSDETIDMPEVSADRITAILRARRLRAEYFPDDLFADPAWDMMLDLLRAELLQQRVAVSSLCAASGVPATTALRWIHAMVDRGLFMRRADPLDGRRVFIELSSEASMNLRRMFLKMPDVPLI